jgi:hypothetical protein
LTDNQPSSALVVSFFAADTSTISKGSTLPLRASGNGRINSSWSSNDELDGGDSNGNGGDSNGGDSNCGDSNGGDSDEGSDWELIDADDCDLLGLCAVGCGRQRSRAVVAALLALGESKRVLGNVAKAARAVEDAAGYSAKLATAEARRPAAGGKHVIGEELMDIKPHARAMTPKAARKVVHNAYERRERLRGVWAPHVSPAKGTPSKIGLDGEMF